MPRDVVNYEKRGKSELSFFRLDVNRDLPKTRNAIEIRLSATMHKLTKATRGALFPTRLFRERTLLHNEGTKLNREKSNIG